MADVSAALADFETALADVVRRLRHVSEGRLTPRVDGVRMLAAELALAAQGVEATDDPVAPAWRALPEVGIFALGDQIAVVGHDLLAAATGRDGAVLVWTPTGRQPLVDVIGAATSALGEARRSL